SVNAESCLQKLNKIKNSAYLGLTETNEYILNSSDSIKRFRKRKAAKLAGFSRLKVCDNGSTSLPDSKQLPDVKLAKKAKACRKVFGIKSTSLFVPLSKVYPLEDEQEAQSLGFSDYQACDESSPISGAPSFTIDTGTRFTDIYSVSVVRLSDDSYRAFLGVSSSSLQGANIATSTSADGLTWSSPQTITGITLDSLATHTNPSAVQLSDDSFVLIYQRVKHISSAGVDFDSLYRGISNDGSSFTLPSEFSLSLGDTSMHSSPSLVSIDSSTMRLYYESLSSIKSAISTDNGATWSDEGDITINGNSDNFAPYPSDPSVIIWNDNRYRIFFSSPMSTSDSNSHIFSAVSEDGRTFQIEQGPILSPSDSTKNLYQPDVISLSGGGYRLYFTTVDTETFSAQIQSAVSSVN
ncbi:MAG: exo-alpha-sialidase, partial [Bdellovibrionales bacterium]|nr:exo-alpha-sialidase [Bdellovibrionales bacterium]